MSNIMTPKQWIKYVRWLEKHNLAICDGTVEELGVVGLPLFELFLFTGMGIFITITYKWDWIKSKFS